MIDFVKKNKDVSAGYVYIIECEGHYKIGKTLHILLGFTNTQNCFQNQK